MVTSVTISLRDVFSAKSFKHVLPSIQFYLFTPVPVTLASCKVIAIYWSELRLDQIQILWLQHTRKRYAHKAFNGFDMCTWNVHFIFCLDKIINVWIITLSVTWHNCIDGDGWSLAKTLAFSWMLLMQDHLCWLIHVPTTFWDLDSLPRLQECPKGASFHMECKHWTYALGFVFSFLFFFRSRLCVCVYVLLLVGWLVVCRCLAYVSVQMNQAVV